MTHTAPHSRRPRVCVFAGSAHVARDDYRNAAAELGALLADRGIDLVYGGGSRGLMGDLADAMLARGGSIIGVITKQLVAKEVAHGHLKDLRVVETMHERKKMMADMADGFIALPGGLGTFDEFFEILTWAQLELHASPIGLVNVQGYFDPLLTMLAHAQREGFLRIDPARAVRVAPDPTALLDALPLRPR